MRQIYRELFYEDGQLEFAGLGYIRDGYFVKHGKGKEYLDGTLWYEGNFVNDERSGKGRAFYEDGTLLYEGDFIGGVWNGKGRLYDRNGTLLCEGDFIDCKLNGKGISYHNDGTSYQGDFVDGYPNGNGQLYDKDGSLVYEGKFVDGNPVDQPSNGNLKDVRSLEECLAELDSMIGLADVKAQVNALVDLIRVQNVRKERGLPIMPMSHHLVFTGNPGTGKTTVARLMAEIYANLGVVSKGTFVETDRAGLVAGYLGQTAIKTEKIIERAKGGVLFIDEAYSLLQDSDSYGMEAIDCLVKRMEDLRGDLVVIAAGYQKPMDHFLEANPGLKSRFSHHIHFENYDQKESIDILKLFCAKNGYSMQDDCLALFSQELDKKFLDHIFMETFSNGRYIRNLFEKLLFAQGRRLASAKLDTMDDAMLSALTIQDLRYIIAKGEFDKTY